MVKKVYSFVFTELKKKNWKLWGITLLFALLTVLSFVLFAGVPAIAIALSWMFSVALSFIMLRAYDGQEIKSDMLFESFKDWDSAKRSLGSMGWASLWIFIWSIIPFAGLVLGPIRHYEYSFVPYIVAREPEVGIKAAKEESSKRTYGWKGSMFWVDALYVAAILVVILIFTGLASIPVIGGLFGILLFLVTVAVDATSILIGSLIRCGFYIETEKLRQGSDYYVEPSDFTSSDSSGSDRFCTACGAKSKDSDKFCSNCGAKLD